MEDNNKSMIAIKSITIDYEKNPYEIKFFYVNIDDKGEKTTPASHSFSINKNTMTDVSQITNNLETFLLDYIKNKIK